MLRPIYGLSRSANTPSCSLYSIAICCAAYLLLYWIIDVKGYGAGRDSRCPRGAIPWSHTFCTT